MVQGEFETNGNWNLYGKKLPAKLFQDKNNEKGNLYLAEIETNKSDQSHH